MFLRVANLGPLREGEVDLSKRLLVLTGQNNTGKTYLAVATYGLAQIGLHVVDVSVSNLVDALLSAPEQRLPEQQARDAIQSLSAELSTVATSSLSRWFAAPERAFESARLALVPERPEPPSTSMEAWRNGMGACCTISTDGIALHLLRRDSGEAADVPWADVLEDQRQAARLIAKLTVWHAFREVLLGISGHEVVFPTERVAVNEFAAELALACTKLVEDLVAGSLLEGDVRSRAGQFALPVRDSLENALTLKASVGLTSHYADMADDLESSILGGGLNLSEHGEVRFAPNGTPGLSLGLHLSASMIKSLAGLVFYFRHLATAGDLIVIDEPELNLHPDSQRKVTQILAKAIRRGFKIMMSTHSDYVIRELNHLLMLSRLPREEAADVGYDPGWALNPEEVGVYLFDHGRIRPVEVGETGFSVETIDEEINRMQQISQRFYAKLSR